MNQKLDVSGEVKNSPFIFSFINAGKREQTAQREYMCICQGKCRCAKCPCVGCVVAHTRLWLNTSNRCYFIL